MFVYKVFSFINNETRKVSGATVNKRTGKKISAIVIVHVFGNAVKLNDLQAICKKRNIVLIEDAAESVGTFYTTGRYKKKRRTKYAKKRLRQRGGYSGVSVPLSPANQAGQHFPGTLYGRHRRDNRENGRSSEKPVARIRRT